MRRYLASGLILFACLFGILFISLVSAPAKTIKKEQCAGVSVCQCCHEEVLKRLEKTAMGTLFVRHPRNTPEELVCESCHGPGKEHADSDGKEFGGMIRFLKGSPTSVAKRNEACLQCHEKKQRLFWQGSSHEIRDVGCTECHVIHTGPESTTRFLLARPTVTETCNICHKKEVGEQMRFSHHPLREGKMSCSSCHNPHGTTSESLIKANYKTELCFSCHPKYRGPVVHPHPPVTEDCSNCHQTHGSAYPRLLKTPQVRLCRECHTTFHGLELGNQGRRRLSHVLGRACTDCHVNVHGSNSPLGQQFLR
jgi:DmsE family decaheme c-type cytochrome